MLFNDPLKTLSLYNKYKIKYFITTLLSLKENKTSPHITKYHWYILYSLQNGQYLSWGFYLKKQYDLLLKHSHFHDVTIHRDKCSFVFDCTEDHCKIIRKKSNIAFKHKILFYCKLWWFFFIILLHFKL